MYRQNNASTFVALLKTKKIDNAIEDLELVLKMKKYVPFKGEIPHRKGPGMSGRYPLKAAKLFINMLKGLKGNVIANQMDLDKTRISLASATNASRPLRRGNVEAKRTNVILKAKEIISQKKKESNKEKSEKPTGEKK